ncbi:cytochrome P450 [Schizophyllum amplum]|uniref:Cytochrome P450 n=1 Tax=Schizophyllum amplum TaxID=97359 RepID=A0A550CBP9_9AGAR|nr:cytochrome P450 [Auriculariopsis ampla]
MLQTALCLLSLSYLFYTLFVRSRSLTKDIADLPGPSPSTASAFLGHEYLSTEPDAVETLKIWAKAFGPMFKMQGALGHNDILVASDRTAVQHIFADTSNYVKAPSMGPPIADIMGKGVVWAEGQDHAKQRKCLSPAFSQDSIKGMAPAIFECAERLASTLSNHVLSQPATLDVFHPLGACTLDIIGRVAFAFDFHALDAAPPPDTLAIRTAFARYISVGATFAAFLVPKVLRAAPWINRIPLPLVLSRHILKDTVRKLARRMLERYESGREEELEKKRDILGLLVNARAKEKDGLTDEQILDNICTLVLVGSETIAGSLAYTLWELARHKDIQTRLRDELLAAGPDLTYETIQRLPYLDAVMKEGLRVHPASPQTERVALRDDVVPLSKPVVGRDGRVMDKLVVKKDQVILLPFTTMNTSPDVWGPDGEVFRPERWLVEGGVPPPEALPHGINGMVTFCDGPRNCLGWRLATFEFKVILAMLVRGLEFDDAGTRFVNKISPTRQPVINGRAGELPIRVSVVS